MAMKEKCSVCANEFDVQLRWQMEERGGSYFFFCSRACYENNLTNDNGVGCDHCGKRFVVELVSQVVVVRGARKHACSDECRGELLKAPRTISSVIPAQNAQSAPTGLAQRLAVFNHKGGTGKTTTAVSIAAALAMRGKRVLLVDVDAQGNVGASLGIASERSLYHVLVLGLDPKEASISVRPNLDVLPSNETLAAAELYLAGRKERDRVLRERLSPASARYDHIVLDCSPSLSLLNQNALVFADELLVPVGCDYLSLVGVRQVLKTVKNVNQLLHHPVRIGGVIPTMFDSRAKICQDSLQTLRDHFGDYCLTPIRASSKLKEAPANQKTIFEWAPESNPVKDYLAVVDQLCARANETAKEGVA